MQTASRGITEMNGEQFMQRFSPNEALKYIGKVTLRIVMRLLTEAHDWS
jgi:hypothetical protein